MRGVAIILVLGAHLRPPPLHSIPPEVSILLDLWMRVGWAGVDIFFVLSGYLVSGLLFSEARNRHTVDVKRFLIRRAFKIYPLFWLTVLLIFLARSILNAPISPSDVLGELLFLQNYVGKLSGPHWSLAVEEHFYLLLALLIGITHTKLRRVMCEPNFFTWVPWVFVAIVILSTGLRWFHQGSEDFWHLVMQTHLRLDSLFLGVFLSWLRHYRFGMLGIRHQALRFTLFNLGCLLFIPVFFFDYLSTWFMRVLVFNSVSVGAGLVLLSGAHTPNSAFQWIRPLSTMGLYSYAIYLVHEPWQRYFVWRISNPDESLLSWWVYFILYISGAIGGGWLLTAAVEQPALRLREHLFPKNRTAP